MPKILALRTPSGILVPIKEIPDGRKSVKRRLDVDEQRANYFFRNYGPDGVADRHIAAQQAKDAAFKRSIDQKWATIARMAADDCRPSNIRKKDTSIY